MQIPSASSLLPLPLPLTLRHRVNVPNLPLLQVQLREAACPSLPEQLPYSEWMQALLLAGQFRLAADFLRGPDASLLAEEAGRLIITLSMLPLLMTPSAPWDRAARSGRRGRALQLGDFGAGRNLLLRPQ